MRTFMNYVSLKELAAYDVGTNMLGHANLDANSEKALTAAMQAFEIIMSKNSQAAIQFLNRMSDVMPEIKTVLQQHGLDSFKDGDFKANMRRAATKGRKFITKGLGDVNTADANRHGVDVIASNSADSYHNPLD